MKTLYRSLTLLLALATGAVAALAFEEARAKAIFIPIPTQAPILKGNPTAPIKVKLGTQLYSDPRLSKSQMVGCNSTSKTFIAFKVLRASVGMNNSPELTCRIK